MSDTSAPLSESPCLGPGSSRLQLLHNPPTMSDRVNGIAEPRIAATGTERQRVRMNWIGVQAGSFLLRGIMCAVNMSSLFQRRSPFC